MPKIKLKYNGTLISDIEPNTTLYEISKKVENDYKYPIVGAKLDEFIVGLNTKIQNSASVKFYDLSTSEGSRIYSRSLEFLVTVATKKILGKTADILIDYSLENGIYCKITGLDITQKDVKEIEEKMHEMVEEKIPYIEMIVNRFDAIKYFKKNNQQDKINSLRYTTNKTITLYSLDGVYDYFFGPLACNTGIIKNFDLIYLKQNSFILTYPNRKNPNELGEYIHHKLTFDTYKKYQEWGRQIKVSTVADLNKISTENKCPLAISFFETYYEDQLSTIASQIYDKKNKIKLILLAGPSSSGKTTTAKKLGIYLKVKGVNSYRISLDDYFKDREEVAKDEEGNYDFANIKSTDIELFNTHLKKLLNGEKVLLPEFNFVEGKKVFKDKYLKLSENDVLIIEGIHTLNDTITKDVLRENKFKIFISPLMHLKIDNHNRIHTTDVRKIRRIVRDSRCRGTSAEETLKMWSNVDKEAIENIYPYQDDADAMINSSLAYELGVLRTYAEPLLYGIDSTKEEYPEATRLINLLRNFLPITSDIVPKDSILREFIGGGIYGN